MKVLDKSFAQADQAWFQDRKAEGWDGFYQDAFTGGERSSAPLEGRAGRDVQLARAAGMKACFYTNVAPWHANGAYCLEEGQRVANVSAPDVWRDSPTVVIDLEIAYYEPTGEWLEERIAHEAIAEARARGFRPVLYTAKWVMDEWAPHLGHMPQFDCDGIYARYDNVPVIVQDEGPMCLTPGHHWIGKQYGGDTIDGVEVDLNIFEDGAFGPSPEGLISPEVKEDDMPTLDELRTLIREELDLTDQRLVELQVRARRQDTGSRFVQVPDDPKVYRVTTQTSWWGMRTQEIAQHVPNERTLEIHGGSLEGVAYAAGGSQHGRVVSPVELITAAELARMKIGAPLPDLAG